MAWDVGYPGWGRGVPRFRFYWAIAIAMEMRRIPKESEELADSRFSWLSRFHARSWERFDVYGRRWNSTRCWSY